MMENDQVNSFNVKDSKRQDISGNVVLAWFGPARSDQARPTSSLMFFLSFFFKSRDVSLQFSQNVDAGLIYTWWLKSQIKYLKRVLSNGISLDEGFLLCFHTFSLTTLEPLNILEICLFHIKERHNSYQNYKISSGY